MFPPILIKILAVIIFIIIILAVVYLVIAGSLDNQCKIAYGDKAFYDPINDGTCYSCPSKNPNRTVHRVDEGMACEAECGKDGWFLDIGANLCAKCPSSHPCRSSSSLITEPNKACGICGDISDNKVAATTKDMLVRANPPHGKPPTFIELFSIKINKSSCSRFEIRHNFYTLC